MTSAHQDNPPRLQKTKGTVVSVDVRCGKCRSVNTIQTYKKGEKNAIVCRHCRARIEVEF